MPSTVTHLIVGLVGGRTVAATKMPRHFWFLSVFCAVLPDMDVLGFRFGISYSDFFGHRGFSHSILFALLVGVFVSYAFFPKRKIFSKSRLLLVFYFSFMTASNGILDALTNGGLGIAFFSPFDNTRYFFPWRPIEVSPIGISAFFSERGMRALLSEIVWVWVPLLVVILSVTVIKKRRTANPPKSLR